jgi:hypothetical protein
MTENEVTAECIGWLREKGWLCRRQHVGAFQPVSGGAITRMGEEGEADWRCLRAAHGKCIEYFELEFKATGKQPRPKQREYAAKRKHQGFNATWTDSLEKLKAWYSEAGYQ